VLLIVAYIPVWWGFGRFQPAYNQLLAGGGRAYFQATGRPVAFYSDVDRINFRIRQGRGLEGWLESAGVCSNAAFLVSLILATPGFRLLARGGMLAAGTGLNYFAHVAFLVTKVETTLISAKHPLAGPEPLWRVVDNFFEITGKVFFPVCIWLLFTLPCLLGSVSEGHKPRGGPAAARNAPCPCGSGLKHKRCCGRRRSLSQAG
jgi:hypothetical protein